MRRSLLLTIVLIAAPAFGQGLGVSPALPDGVSALTVTPQAGPWMILAASYSGQPARELAEELATEIRTRYSLPAYVFNRTAEERRLENERIARIKEEHRKQLKEAGLPEETAVYIKTVRIEDQYAVLVGGYKDDVTARKALEQIRKLKPKSSNLNKFAYVPDAKGQMHEEAISPFQSAFVCHNPTVAVEKPKQEADQSQKLKAYNSGESYSLLKCGKPFTLVVKSYRCATTVQAQHTSGSIMDKVGLSKSGGNILDANAKEAHELAEVLRKLKFEAYVLHSEYNSFVTIGAFDSSDDPRLVQAAQNYMRELTRTGSGLNQLYMRIQLMAEPVQMPVPQVK